MSKTINAPMQMGAGWITPSVHDHLKQNNAVKVPASTTQTVKTQMGAGWIVPSVFAHINNKVK